MKKTISFSSQEMQGMSKTLLNMGGACMVKHKRKTISRTKKLVSSGNQECIAICNGKWLQAACQILSWNSVNKFLSAAAVCDLLEKSCKKYLNMYLVGPSNCGKFPFRALGTDFKLFH